MICKTLLFLSVAIGAVAQPVTDETLQQIKVTAGRSSAMMQFNMLAVRVWLPRSTNSAFATETFAKPLLADPKNQPVEYDLQQGLYDHDKWKNEIRLTPKGEATRVVGTIQVRYPIRLRTAQENDLNEKLTKPAMFVKLPAVFVEEWKTVEIAYNLPVPPKLPDSARGQAQRLPDNVSEMPGGKVVVTVKPGA